MYCITQLIANIAKIANIANIKFGGSSNAHPLPRVFGVGEWAAVHQLVSERR